MTTLFLHLFAATAAKSLQSCPTVRPHGRQPTRLPCPWDPPGRNTGVGCHLLLPCMKVKSETEVAHNEYSGLISFKIDWLDLLAVQGTFKSLLQHHNSKASILWCSAFFIVQHSHPYMTTGKTIALTRWAFIAKVMSLLFNMMSRLVITPSHIPINTKSLK